MVQYKKILKKFTRLSKWENVILMVPFPIKEIPYFCGQTKITKRLQFSCKMEYYLRNKP